MLANENLAVEMHPDLPFPKSYRHLASATRFSGAPPSGHLTINGSPVPWQRWEIVREGTGPPNAAGYELRLQEPEIALRLNYELSGFVLALRLAVLSDPKAEIKTVGFDGLPLLACDEKNAVVWREEWTQNDWDAKTGRGLWRPSIVERPLSKFEADAEARPCIYCCVYRPGVCATIRSSERYMPLRNQVVKSDGRASYEISLATYQFRARKRCLPPLSVEIAFLPDLNGDGRPDASDYQLWINHRLPQPWPNHRNAIWYKIYCGDHGRPMTTFAQAEEIVERVHRYTDGLPQIAYLVGWQYEGHDSGYPSIDRVNTHLGTRDELWAFHRRAKNDLNATISYHINLDDSYKTHPGWDPSVISRQPDGELMRWEPFADGMSYHINHTKDVESGRVFERLKAMMSEVPLEGAIHVDAFRDMNWSWEPDGLIGPVEEIECGIKPILEFFNARGIDVTIESLDSQGAEWCGLIAGILHVGLPFDLPQLRHGKLLYGGRRYPPSLWEWGLGSSINWDQIFTEDGKDFDARGAWHELLDGIYLGTLLYHYYLERELTVAHIDDKEARLRFSDGVETLVRRDNSLLRVTRGDVVIADGFDRFIPRDGRVYAYSRDGSERTWRLPTELRGRSLRLRPLGSEKDESKVVAGGSDRALKLQPRVPLKISTIP